MNTITLNQTDKSIPESWTEVSISKFEMARPFIAEGITDEVKIKVLCTWLGIEVTQFLKQPLEVRAALLLCMDWMQLPNISESPIKMLRFEGVDYFLPEPQLSNVCLIEMAQAGTYWQRITGQTLDHPDIPNLIATLVRPEKTGEYQVPEWDGDRREKFNSAKLKKYAEIMARLPLEMKYSILVYLTQQFEAFNTRYKYVLEDANTTEIPTKAQKPVKGYMELIYSLSETKIFGSFDETCFANVHTVMNYLAKKKYENTVVDVAE